MGFAIPPGGVRDLLVDYLSELKPGMDYGTLEGWAYRLVRLFWREVVNINPTQSDLRLDPATVTAWRERLAIGDVTLTQASYFVLGNISTLLIGFLLGVLMRSSTGAVVAYFSYTFLVPTLFGLLSDSQAWFRELHPWVDIQFAQTGLFLFDSTLTGEQWAQNGVTALVWLIAPLLPGLRLVMKAEVK